VPGPRLAKVTRGEPALPPLATQAANFAGAVVRDLKAGRPRRTEAEVEELMAICEACEFMRQSDRRCSKCGCRLKAKIPWGMEHCPVDKW
jgi:uncharacterized paraquat-inducible protein A